MALTRKFLSALGIEADKVDEIINAHIETVDALKEERDKYKADAESLPGLQKELKELKEAQAKAGDGNAFEVKYKAIKEDFEKYKADIEAKETRQTKEAAYRKLLKDSNVSNKRIDAIIKVSGDIIDGIEIDENGNVKDSTKYSDSIKKEWEDFIVTEQKKGASTATPPQTNNDGGTLTKKDIMKIKDTQERQKAWGEYVKQGGV